MLSFIKKIFINRPVDYKELIGAGAIIIDVRTGAEFKSGHIAGSKNIPLDSIRSKITELKNLNKPVVTVCRSGARSGMAIGILKAAGIDAYNGGPGNNLKNKIS